MPRFQDAHVLLLRATIKRRLPDCNFTEDDIGSLVSDTGLDAAQIQQWGWNFRLRVPLEERARNLSNPLPDKVIFILYCIC